MFLHGCAVPHFSVVPLLLPPPPASRLPPATNKLPPANCHQQTATNQLPPTNFHQPIATNQLPPTNFHQPIAINKLPPTKLPPTTCHQPAATKQLPPTNCHRRCAAIICVCLQRLVLSGASDVRPGVALVLVGHRRATAVISVAGEALGAVQGVGCTPWRRSGAAVLCRVVLCGRRSTWALQGVGSAAREIREVYQAFRLM